MKAKQVCKLQENLAKEAIAYLMLLSLIHISEPTRRS